MGIESEQLVFDYLSRVGDLAHSTPMSAAERARLVSDLRATIDRQRAEADGGAESPGAVKKILKRIGRPEDVVASAGAGGGGRGEPAVPEQRTSSAASATAASPPHLAGMDELTSAESDPDWWRGDPSPYAKGNGGEVSGFVGGIEIPEMLKPPPVDGQPGQPGQPGPSAPEPEPGSRKGVLGRLRPAKGVLLGAGDGVSRVSRVGGPVELLAALVLVAGAVLGNLITLGVGWLLAWWSPRLSRTEGKWAAMGMPGLVAGAGLVWLWGRVNDRWGEPIGEGEMAGVLNDAYPWVLRGAAVASALFLLWRARRRAA
ncbi:hypothetical protein [Streptomyces gobiensis]|uniref:hypothetical protein n=1 Tax=Streptomyces gobiensis TaxID=2875706 RepID=UPI001E56AE23|nr:hypothetical protein [Streptomyces gobiensis]UGY92078.1 hypothetical protein test1122_10315 [Streptomyces gobiensis]